MQTTDKKILKLTREGKAAPAEKGKPTTAALPTIAGAPKYSLK
jgi:hypothetical protein